MVGSSYDQKPYRRSMMQTWGATVHRSPSDLTESGRAQAGAPDRLARASRSPRPSRSPRRTRTRTTRSARCSTTCCLHQTVIGQETIAQMEMAGEEPDVVIGCVGGGSNFAGLAFPWLRRKLRDGATTRFVGAEPAACPTLTEGVYAYDFGDTVGLTPLMPMYTLGHDFVPPPVHAGGLRYHGDSPLLCATGEGRPGRGARRAAERDVRGGGAVRAHRGDHPGARVGARDPRRRSTRRSAAKEAGEERVILFNLSGHGHFDLAAYDAYLSGDARGPGVRPHRRRRGRWRGCRRTSRR